MYRTIMNTSDFHGYRASSIYVNRNPSDGIVLKEIIVINV
jgi:hypothetical protein